MVWIAAEVKHRQSEEVCVGRMATSDPMGHPGRAKVDPDVSFLLSAVVSLTHCFRILELEVPFQPPHGNCADLLRSCDLTW